MSHVNKAFNRNNYSLTETKAHKTQYINSGSDGVFSVQFRSGSMSGSKTVSALPDVSGSYWNSLLNLFYASGSQKISASGESEKFKDASLTYINPVNPRYHDKFFTSGSVISIPQMYYGEGIKQGTFVLTDNSHPSGTIILKDDKYGNLYSSNSTISASADSAISSSYNYAGNIFYNSGIVILTETSSHSHTPSTASITVGTLVSPAIPGFNKIFITSSDLTTGITFVSTGSTETDTSTVKYFASASTAAITATSASAKINSVFGGEHISASVSSNTINLTNNANDLVNRITTNKNNNLPRISGSAGFATTKGFGGGVASVEYTHAAASGYSIDFKSTQTIFTHEYLIEIDPGDFNHTMNPTARGFASGSTLTRGTESPFLRPRLTASGWSPYLSGISLYQDGGPYFDHSEYPYKPIIEPVIIAKFPNAIKMRNDMKMIFKLRLDM